MQGLSTLISFFVFGIFSVFNTVTYATSVSTAKLSSLVYYPSSTYTGEVIARDTTLVSAQVSALVDTLIVMPGDQVNKGEVISIQDCRDYLDKLAINKATIDEIDANFELTNIQINRQAKVEIPTLKGKVKMSIAAGTQSGTKLRIKDRGLGKTPGNQYVTVQIHTPLVVSDEDKALYEKMQAQMAFDPRADL